MAKEMLSLKDNVMVLQRVIGHRKKSLEMVFAGPSYGTRKKQRSSEKELGNGFLDFQEEPCIETRRDWAASFPDSLTVAKKDAGDKEIVDVALQNSKKDVDDFESKQSENVNDSLLEDLLNDCKRKRRDSLATISEENERIKEHHRGNATGTDKDSEFKHRRSYERESSTECRLSDAVKNHSIPNSLFQTASGKSVSVSNAALSKARNTWRKIDQELALDGNDKLQHKDLASLDAFQTVPARTVDDLQSSLSIRQAPGIKWKRGRLSFGKRQERLCFRRSFGRRDLDGDANSQIEEVKDDRLGVSGETDKASKSNAFLGFQTAAGKRVDMSEKALQRGAQIMQEIDNSLEQGITKIGQNTDRFSGSSGSHNGIAKTARISGRASHKDTQIIQRTDKSLERSEGKTRCNSTGLSGFSGFQTASGQSVNLSKESIEKGAAIMQQIDRSLEQNKDKSVSHSRSTSGFSGFQTASGQNVKLSKESIEKGTAIMHEIDRSIEQNRDSGLSHSPSTSGFSGFQTASGQNVKLSKESIEKGSGIMHEIDRSIEQNRDSGLSHSHNTSGFSGFQTASGQSVKLSKESLVKGTAIMQQIDKSLEQNREGSASATSFSGSEPSVTSFSGFSGFQTAGGKTVQISESALAKAKETMAGIDRELQTTSPETPTISDYASRKAREPMKLVDQQIDKSTTVVTKGSHGGKFKGFFTAGGQSVSISEEALTKAKGFLLETDNAFSDSKMDGTTFLPERAAPTVVHGRTVPTPDRSCSVEHDEAVSREVLESSNALLAYESIMDDSEYLHDRAAAGLGSFNTSSGSLVERGKVKLIKGATCTS
ncbi:hypothetical protein OS493_021457 [Desmophyllum pertusum]|uniref:Uncharacterized protein n=1 Tax=Desmophyllum pertusum TaxID=174260 RepID=A0A9X0CSN4_9CNID|nr:hypothetical protein OS493_021457 [Desmophyllum pertusum]